MKLPLIADIDSRDGSSNRDERLTNTLAEQDGQIVYACIRPALNQLATETGVGNGLASFNGVLISVYGTSLGFGTTPTALGTIIAGTYDFAQSAL